MKVVHHLRGVYYLLKHNGQYFFDVNAGRGAVGFSISIALSEEQETAFRKNGTGYLQELAEFIHQEQAYYFELQVSQHINRAMHRAVAQWKEENNTEN